MMSDYCRCARSTRLRAEQRGISMIELMIGMVVGLIVALAVTSTVSTMNLQRRTAVSGGDAQANAQLALILVDRTARMSGAGLFYNGQLICTGINIYHDGSTLANDAPILPVKIVDGGATGSDAITFTYSNAVGGSAAANLVDAMATEAAPITVNHQGGLRAGDLAIVGVPGSAVPCTLIGITAFDSTGANCNAITTACTNIVYAAGTTIVNGNVPGKWNPPDPATAFGANAQRYGFASAAPLVGPAVASGMGSFVQDTYQVMCNSLVSYPYTSAGVNAPACTASPLSITNASLLVSDIVQMQAQYGITASAASNVVTNWVDATGGTWTTPNAATIPRIKAVRIVVVARSKEAAAGLVTAACTNAAGVASTGPCSFQDAEAPVIDLSATSVPAGKTWQNYRYRVYQSVIPLRNVSWNY